MEDLNKYKDNESRLRNNIEPIHMTFERFGLKAGNVGLQFANFMGGPGIKFFVELIGEGNLEIVTYNVKIKVNVYDKNDNLLGMGETSYNLANFIGFDTVDVIVFYNHIFSEAAKVKVFISL